MSAGTTSVVIPVFNGAAFIEEAIASVREQTRPVDEIIVVDDGSTDDTVALVEALPAVTLLRQANAGPAAARNRGVDVAGGDYIALLDADDLWPPWRQATMAGLLDDRPDVGIVMGHQQLLVMEGATLPSWVPDVDDLSTVDPDLLPRPTGSLLARRAVFDSIGGYAEGMHHGEDSDWFLRARDAGFVAELIDDHVLTRRIHGTNLTNDTEGQRLAMFDVLQRRMARRRAAANEVGDAP